MDPNLSEYTSSINALRSKKNPQSWGSKQNEDFEKIQELVAQSNILKHPELDKQFIVKCDARKKEIGVVLLQVNKENKLQPVEFGSKQLDKTQQRWHVSE